MVLTRDAATGGNGVNGAVIANPISSANSRRAASSAGSGSANSPLGIDHAPSSRRAQNGPPGCTSSTSPDDLRSNTPALRFTHATVGSRAMDPAGRHIVITGAASGIGRACAIAFAEEGATVTASDVD